MSSLRMLLLLGVALLIGCGQDVERVEPVEGPPPREELQTILEHVAQTGQGGSELGLVMEKINDIEETDPALAAALRDDANELMSLMGNPPALQGKARDMLETLDAADSGGG